MAEIRITLKSDLCAGSGESLGNVVDTDMCVDAFGLPIIPGRRIKGCLRQAAEELKTIGLMESKQIDDLFGDALDHAGALSICDAELEHADDLRALLLHGGVRDIPGVGMPAQVSRMFTTIRGQTKMEDGVAAPGSLRYIRVLNHTSPITGEDLCMVAPVSLEDESLAYALEKCCKALRHIGMHRNRGLGWIKVEYNSGEQNGDNKPQSNVQSTQNQSEVRLSYRVALDANLALSGIDGHLTAIPGRSVIGCMASAWMKQNGGAADQQPGRNDDFRRLFLSGETKWSDLTPVIDGRRSTPAPLMIANLKNRKFSQENKDLEIQSAGDAMYGNRLVDDRFLKDVKNGGWRGEKIKTVEGLWAVETIDGWKIAGVETDTMYHHRHERNSEADAQKPSLDDEAMLYSHTSVPSGLIYGGEVTVPANLSKKAEELLRTAQLRFGHSRNAQYARCSLLSVKPIDHHAGTVTVNAKSTIFVILESNTLISANGRYALDNASVRKAIGEALEDESKGPVLSKSEIKTEYICPENCIDYVQYTTIGGYHAMWKLQKPQTCVVAGGSVFCFVADKGKDIPAEFTLGEYRQEGMGRCRVISEEEMKEKKIIPRARIDTRYKMKDEKTDVQSETQKSQDKEHEMTDAQRAFKEALLINTAEESVSASAVVLAETVLKEKDGKYKDLDDGRLRTMLEESTDLANLRARLKPRKEGAQLDSKKKAAKALLDMVYGENDIRIVPKSLLRTNDKLLHEIDGENFDDKKRQAFCDDNWKRLLSIILKIYEHGSSTNDGDNTTSEEAQV